MDTEAYNDVPFQGREEFLKDFLNAWKVHGFVVFGIFGMKSVGKSRTMKKHRNTVERIIRQENSLIQVKRVNINMKTLTTSNELYEQMCKKLGLSQTSNSENQRTASFEQIELHIRQYSDQFFIIVFVNCEAVIQPGLKKDFESCVVTLAKIRRNIHVYITSTEEILFTQIQSLYYSKTLHPMNETDSKLLLKAAAKRVDFGKHLDKIIDLCGGLPLALLMVGSELEADEGILKPEDMVELLTECRLRALSRENYPAEDRIADVYKEFIQKLSAVFQHRLATLGYIRGSFTAMQAKEMLDHQSEASTNDQTLIPLQRKSYLRVDAETGRFVIHSILRDCLSVYFCIQDMPAVRKKFCQIFTKEMQKISTQMSLTEYMEALASFNLENPNLQQLLKEVLHTPEETYSFFIEVASTCYPLLETYMASHSEMFYKGCLNITNRYGKPEDEAIVKISYGSLLTNAKGDTIHGEKYYREALQVFKDTPHNVKLAEVQQRLGWNLYVQGRANESASHLKISLETSLSQGRDRTVICLQSFNSLGVVNTVLGNFEDAEKYFHECLRRHRINLDGENLERKKQEKKLVSEDEMPKFGSIFNNMGILYEQKGDTEKALFYFEKGFQIKRQLKVPTTAMVASMKNLAANYSLLGRHEEALELLKEAESIALKESPPNEYDLSLIYDTFGRVYMRNQEFAKARKYLQKAVESREGNMANSPMHAESVLNLCQAEIGLKNYEAAKNLATNVVSMKHNVIKNMPQNNCILDALECLVTICLHLNTENCWQLQETNESLKEEYQRLIRFHTERFSDRLVQHYRQKLSSIENNVSGTDLDSLCNLTNL